MMESSEFSIKGVAPLVMHNGALVDSANPWVKLMKPILGKQSRARTEADLTELARLEFMGSLYLDENEEPCIPGELIESMAVEAAKRSKKGKLATAAIISDGNWSLQYSGPRSRDALWNDAKHRFIKSARVGQARVMRSRPIFREWACEFVISFDTSILDRTAIVDIVKQAEGIGICDWRPKYGRFEQVAKSPRTKAVGK